MNEKQKTGDHSRNGHENLERGRLPGQIEIDIPGLRANDSVSAGIQKSESQNLVKKLHDEGKHIIAKTVPGKLVLYVGVSAVLIGGIAGGVYLRKRKSEKTS